MCLIFWCAGLGCNVQTSFLSRAMCIHEMGRNDVQTIVACMVHLVHGPVLDDNSMLWPLSLPRAASPLACRACRAGECCMRRVCSGQITTGPATAASHITSLQEEVSRTSSSFISLLYVTWSWATHLHHCVTTSLIWTLICKWCHAKLITASQSSQIIIHSQIRLIG